MKLFLNNDHGCTCTYVPVSVYQNSKGVVKECEGLLVIRSQPRVQYLVSKVCSYVLSD